MTDEEYRQQVRQRWKESMELLGLDPGPEPELPPQTAPAKAPEPRHEEIFAPPRIATKAPAFEKTPADREPERTRHDFDERQNELKAQEPPRRAERDDFDSELSPEPEAAQADEAAPEPAEDAATDAAETDEQSSRRRRGRRGRRGKKTDSASAEGESDVADEAPAAEDEAKDKDASGKRGRGRGRPRQRAKPVEEETAEHDESATDEAAGDGDFGDDEPTSPSEWDVPSWQDLIASLYRPER